MSQYTTSHHDTEEDAKSEKKMSKRCRLKLWFAKNCQSFVQKLHNAVVRVWGLMREEKTWIWATLVLSLTFVVGAPVYHFYNSQGNHWTFASCVILRTKLDFKFICWRIEMMQLYVI